MKNFSLRTQLIMIVSLVLIAGFFSTNIMNYYTAKRELRNTIIRSSLPLTRDNIYSEIQRDLMRPIFVSSLMAHDTFLKDWALNGEKDTTQIIKYLKEIKNKYDFFTAFYVSNKTNNYYSFKGVEKKISKEVPFDSWYFNFISQQTSYELNIDPDEHNNNILTIFINHRLHDYDNNLLGVAGVGLDLRRITNLLSSYQVKYSRNIFLVDMQGKIKAHSDLAMVDYANIFDMEGIKQHAPDILTTSYLASNYEYDKDGHTILLTSRYIPEMNWFLVVEQNQTFALQSIRQNFTQSIIFGIIISIIIIIINILTINHFQKRLEQLATTDKLTGTYNRRIFDKIFSRCAHHHQRNKQPFSLIMFDLDNFKNVNDTLGHGAGDEALAEVAHIAQDSIRFNDRLFRWGGDEFIILCEGGLSSAVNVAKRIAESAQESENLSKTTKGKLKITLSFGISQYDQSSTPESLSAEADHALFEAKKRGKNRICYVDVNGEVTEAT